MTVCNLCGNNSFTTVWDKVGKDNVLLLKDANGVPIHNRNVVCNHCGLVFLYPMMSPESLNEFYTNYYRKFYPSSDEHQLQSEFSHASNAYSLVSNLSIKTHLDVGASNGMLVKLMGHFGIKSKGIEIDPTNSARAKENGLDVENTSLENYKTKEKYELVTMLNALEHVYDPTDVLTRLRDLMTDDGHLLISVPDIYNVNIKRNVSAYLSNAHTYNFSSYTLAQMMSKVGLKPKGMTYKNEEIGNKLYVLAQKTEDRLNQFKKIDPQFTVKFVELIDELLTYKYKIDEVYFND